MSHSADVKFWCSFTILSIWKVNIFYYYYYLFMLPFSSEKEEESEASETTISPRGELWCKKLRDHGSESGRTVGISAHLKPFILFVDYMHLMYQLHLEPTKAAKTVFSSSGSWTKMRHFLLSVCWSSLLFSGVLKLPLDVFICCMVLKIEGVSIKIMWRFKINPCHQNVYIFLHVICLFIMLKSEGSGFINIGKFIGGVAVFIVDHTVAV